MRPAKAILGGIVAAALVVAPMSSAFADWHHHRGGRGVGLIGGLFLGAATIATLPFAIVGSVVAPRPAYAGPPPGYYGPPPGYAGAPPGYAGPPPGYYGAPRGYYGPPQGYGPPPPQYYGPPPGY